MPVSRLSNLNWRRGFAEVALIFIGITLALLFDNWNEARKDRLLEEQLFAALRADLLETRADLVTDIETAQRRATNTKKLIEALTLETPPENAGRDLPWRDIGTSRLFEKDFAYRALVAQGLDSISNWEILKATTDLYELQLTRVAKTENSAFTVQRQVLELLYPHMGVPTETMQISLSDQGTASFLDSAPLEILDWEAMQADRELTHWLMESLKRTLAALDFYEAALARLDEIVGMIDEEIGPATQPH